MEQEELMNKTLIDRIAALEQRVQQLEDLERECQKEKKALQQELAEIKEKSNLLKQLEQVEDNLRQVEERLQLALNSAKMIVWDINLKTNQVVCCENATKMWGVQIGTAEDFFAFVHPDDRQNITQAHEQALAGKTAYHQQYRVISPNGQVRWLDSQGTVYLDATGQPERLIGISLDITERKQVEAELREREQRFTTLFNGMEDWVLVYHLTPKYLPGKFIEVNEQACKRLGYSREELLTMSVTDIVCFTNLTPQFLIEKLQILKHIVLESIHRTKTGELIPVEVSATLFTLNGLPTIQAICRDITGRKQVEAEKEELLLREQAARVEAETAKEEITKILESITDGFVAFDRQWRFTYINHEGTRTLGKPAQELLGKNLWEELPEVAETSFGRLFQQTMTEGLALELEDYYAPFNAWFSVRVYPSDAGIILYFRNISDRKQTEAEIANLNRNLQNRINELQTLFEVIPIGILISDDPEFKNIRANPAFAKILGTPINSNASCTPPAGSSPPNYKIFSNGKELTPEETPLRYAGINNVHLQGVEVDILRGDGVLFNIYGYASPLLDEQGKPRGAVGAFLDISDRKRIEAEREQILAREKIAREQAEAANRVKDEFLAVLSHELRTPLNPILGWTKLLQTGKLDQRKTALALATIERNTKLQTQLIEDLLDISRILQGKLTLHIYPVDLAMTIEAAKETMRLAAEAKLIQVRTDLKSAICVMGDANRLQQVVWNLLSNAVKFTPTGGLIDVKLESINGYAQIAVKDTGKGINPEFLPYVFEYFRQADSSITRKFGGLGLGLAIARQIVELHGGTIEVESPGEGLGATFTVALPLITGTIPINQSNRALNPNLNLQNRQILVVDDEADTRELIAFFLQQYGAKIITAASAKEALNLMQQLTFDLLISDIGMPEMDGYSLMRQVRSLNLTKQIPAIALTAYASEADQKQAILSGFQLHIAKPLELEQLTQAIFGLLKTDSNHQADS